MVIFPTSQREDGKGERVSVHLAYLTPPTYMRTYCLSTTVKVDVEYFT